MTKSVALISPNEVAERLGKKNPEHIREALRAGTFPIGFAYKADGKWVYAIPRKAFERFMETGCVNSPDDRHESEILAILREVQEMLAQIKTKEVA